MISRQTLSFSLRRLGLALLTLFVVNNLFGLLPLELTKAAWQLRAIDLLLTTAPFTLLGAALLLLSERHMSRLAKPLLSAKLLRKLARLASIGFLLLIPLLISAVWTQIRSADVAAQATIRSLERRVNGVRSAGSGSELITLSAGLPADWQPRPSDSLAANRARLLGRVEPELAKLRTNVDQRKNQAIQVGLKEGSKNALLALIYAWALTGIRHRISATDVFDESIEEPIEEPFDEYPDGSFEDSFAEPHDDSDLEDPELSNNA
jgi:hypothetical protein